MVTTAAAKKNAKGGASSLSQDLYKLAIPFGMLLAQQGVARLSTTRAKAAKAPSKTKSTSPPKSKAKAKPKTGRAQSGGGCGCAHREMLQKGGAIVRSLEDANKRMKEILKTL